MKKLKTDRKYVLAGLILTLTVFVALGVISEEKNSRNDLSGMNWTEIEVEDVSTGESFSVEELEKPVLVETFAVWCSTCTRQQQEVKQFHEESNVTSISLNTDPNEDAARVRQHKERHGFDWRYAVAPTEMSRKLADRHGDVMLQPPRAPMVLICENGERMLPTGVKPVSELSEEAEKDC